MIVRLHICPAGALPRFLPTQLTIAPLRRIHPNPPRQTVYRANEFTNKGRSRVHDVRRRSPNQLQLRARRLQAAARADRLRPGGRRRGTATCQCGSPAGSGPLVPYLAPPSSSSSLSEPINAVPLAAFAPDSRVEPWWVRGKLFPHLKLRFELPVHFIAENTVTATDLDPHQNRFRLPTDGVLRNLRPILSPIELAAANLLHDEAPRPRPPRQLVVPEDQNQEGMRKKKRKGKKHGGLPVLVVDYDAGIRELQMSRWESSRGVIIKGEGYLGFIADCSFKVGDAVEIWAFRERFFRLFGSNVCADSPLHVLITKKG